MQAGLPLSFREERLAKDLTALLRRYYRRSGEAQWFDLDVLFAQHSAIFHGCSRPEAVAAMYGHWPRGPRFDVFFTADATRADGFRYEVSLRQYLLQNHRGV